MQLFEEIKASDRRCVCLYSGDYDQNNLQSQQHYTIDLYMYVQDSRLMVSRRMGDMNFTRQFPRFNSNKLKVSLALFNNRFLIDIFCFFAQIHRPYTYIHTNRMTKIKAFS